MKPARVVIVDDHSLLRAGISGILKQEPDFEVIGEAGTVAAAVKLVLALVPDLVLMDYSLPDGNGLEATREILASQPQINIVLLTVHEEDELLYAALRSGAHGYLLKNVSKSELLARLRGLAKGDTALQTEQRRRILAEFAHTAPVPMVVQQPENALTERELDVLELIVDGGSNKEIAAELQITIHTVKNHVQHIFRKLDVYSRHEAAAAAVKRGLVSANKH
ncbi:MAG: response regulator [Candidatus Promineifilaceae bacterium]